MDTLFLMEYYLTLIGYSPVRKENELVVNNLVITRNSVYLKGGDTITTVTKGRPSQLLKAVDKYLK